MAVVIAALSTDGVTASGCTMNIDQSQDDLCEASNVAMSEDHHNPSSGITT